MKTKRIAAFILGLTLAALAVSTPMEASRVNVRQLRQGARIAAGVCAGQLTRREAARLSARQAALARAQRIMRLDGLSLRERRALERRQDRLSRDIYRQRHDAQNRRF
jgi:hypothetical protein